MPNTFYAKQAEYASWQASPLQNRLFFWGLQFFLGVSLALIPGFISKIIQAVRGRDWGLLLAAAWLCGYNLVYLMRLPVYQHGRYYLPALAVFLLIGLSGMLESLLPFPRLQTSILRAAWLGFFVLILPLSYLYGGMVFGQDTALIESQMVDTARWVAKNLPPEAVIAAHDIGALGFFDRHPLVDLAGLISPAVVPIINDDQALVAYMWEEHVQYLVTFQGWKPELHSGGVQVFSSSANPVGSNDLGAMTVFRLSDPSSSIP